MQIFWWVLDIRAIHKKIFPSFLKKNVFFRTNFQTWYRYFMGSLETKLADEDANVWVLLLTMFLCGQGFRAPPPPPPPTHPPCHGKPMYNVHTKKTPHNFYVVHLPRLYMVCTWVLHCLRICYTWMCTGCTWVYTACTWVYIWCSVVSCVLRGGKKQRFLDEGFPYVNLPIFLQREKQWFLDNGFPYINLQGNFTYKCYKAPYQVQCLFLKSVTLMMFIVYLSHQLKSVTV